MSGLSDDAKVILVQSAIEGVTRAIVAFRQAGHEDAAAAIQEALDNNRRGLDGWLEIQRKARS